MIFAIILATSLAFAFLSFDWAVGKWPSLGYTILTTVVLTTIWVVCFLFVLWARLIFKGVL